MGQELGQIYSFQFAAGGTASVYVEQSIPSSDASPGVSRRRLSLPEGGRALQSLPPSLDILLCSESDLENNILTFSSVSSICNALDLDSRCSAYAKLVNNGNHTFALTVNSATTLHIIYVGCAGVSQHLSASWNCQNPGGEALPAGQIPLKSWSLSFGAIWATGAGLLALNLAHASTFFAPPPSWASAQLAAAAGNGDEALRDPQLNNAVRHLHWGLLCTAAAFCAEGFIGNVLWVHLSRTCYNAPDLDVTHMIAWDFASALLVGLIMLISRGWQVTRLHLERSEYSSLAGLLALYVIAWLSWQFFTSVTSLFLLMLAYVLMLRYTFASSAWSLRLLTTFTTFSRSVRNAVHRDAQRADAGVADARLGEYAPLNGSAPSAPRPAWRWPWSREPIVARTSAQPDTPREEEEAAVSLTDGGLSSRQIAFMRKFRIVAGLYITIDMVAELATDVLPSSDSAPWVGYSTQIIAALSSWIFLAWTFRAQADPAASPLFDPRGYLETSPLTAELLGEDARGAAAHARWGYAGRIGGDDEDDATTAANAAARAASILAASSAAASRGRPADQVVVVTPGDQGAQGSYVLAEELVQPPPECDLEHSSELVGYNRRAD
jgi:hypothetical protein